MKSQKEFGLLIKEKRIEKGYTQKQLAEKLFVSEKAVSRWECGEGYPSIYILEDLGDLLNISFYELFDSNSESDKSNAIIKYLNEKKNKHVLIKKAAVTILFFLLFIVSFFPLNSHLNSDSNMSLFSIMLSATFLWQSIVGAVFFLFVTGGVVLSSVDFAYYLKNKKQKIVVFVLDNVFCLIALFCSLLFELMQSSNLHIFGYLSFVVCLFIVLINYTVLLSTYTVSENSGLKVKTQYWLITAIIFLIISVSLYFSSLYLSLVILQGGNLLFFRIVMFLYGVLIPIVCTYFFINHFKCKKAIQIISLLSVTLFQITIFILTCFNVSSFGYIFDVFVYLGIIHFPFLGFCFLDNINKFIERGYYVY